MCHVNQPPSRKPIVSDSHLPELLLKSLLLRFSEEAVFAIDTAGSYIFFNDRYAALIEESNGWRDRNRKRYNPADGAPE